MVDSWRDRERALRRLGAEVELLCAAVWDQGGADVRLVPRSDEPVRGVRTWGRHPALFVYDPRPLWHALGESWDVVDLHEEPFALATAEVLLLRWFRRQRAPYTLYSAQNIHKRYPPPFRWLERWALRHAAGISVCNETAGQIVSSKGLLGGPTLIPLGIDQATFTSAPAAPGAKRPDRISVGYVGRLAVHKGVDVLLEAVAGDRRLHLHLAGSGPAEAALRDETRARGLEDRVRFLGPVPHEELPRFYAGLDVLAVPSLPTPGWLEQFGRVAVEAMACGVPVVASVSGALPDVVGGVGVLVPPGDPGSLRDALVHLGTDSAAAASATAAGLVRSRECSWDRVAERYLQMYGRAVHAPLATPASQRQVEVVVVAYGSPALLRSSLEPVRRLAVTVVDNSSSPDVRRVCAELGVAYRDPGSNRGFAAGVNEALAHRLVPEADVLLLNPDAVVEPQVVTTLHAALLADPGLASVGPTQVDPAGVPSRVTWPFPSPLGTWFDAAGLGRLRRGPGYVIGSVLLLRAEALAQVGAFDESFFLYAEETDWAYRAHLLGWRHAEVPGVSATHVGAGTSADPHRRQLQFHAAQERYMRKHFGTLGWQVARAGQVAGASVRALALTGERRRNARRHLRLYLRGPVRARAATSTMPHHGEPASAA